MVNREGGNCGTDQRLVKLFVQTRTFIGAGSRDSFVKEPGKISICTFCVFNVLTSG